MRSAALGAVVLAALAAAGVASAQTDVPTRGCRSHVESGRGPIGFAADGVVAGPIAFSGLRRVATRLPRRGEDGRYFVKSGVTVRAGRAATVSIPERIRKRIGLAYTHADPVAAVRFEPCPPNTRAFSYDGRVGPVTAFNGGFILTRPGCYRLVVRVEGGRTYNVRVPFGSPCR